MNADGPAPKVLLADKDYDADFICEDMEKRGGTAMIPTKRNRKVQLPVDPAIYALRNMVERCFNKLKNARRLATRYDKTADSYLGFIHIVSIRLWMRQFVNASYVMLMFRVETTERNMGNAYKEVRRISDEITEGRIK